MNDKPFSTNCCEDIQPARWLELRPGTTVKHVRFCRVAENLSDSEMQDYAHRQGVLVKNVARQIVRHHSPPKLVATPPMQKPTNLSMRRLELFATQCSFNLSRSSRATPNPKHIPAVNMGRGTSTPTGLAQQKGQQRIKVPNDTYNQLTRDS